MIGARVMIGDATALPSNRSSSRMWSGECIITVSGLLGTSKPRGEVGRALPGRAEEGREGLRGAAREGTIPDAAL